MARAFSRWVICRVVLSPNSIAFSFRGVLFVDSGDSFSPKIKLWYTYSEDKAVARPHWITAEQALINLCDDGIFLFGLHFLFVFAVIKTFGCFLCLFQLFIFIEVLWRIFSKFFPFGQKCWLIVRLFIYLFIYLI